MRARGSDGAAGETKPLCALEGDVVNLEALEEELPNGLHDALLSSISYDLVAQTADFTLDVWVGNLDSKIEAIREEYRSAHLRLTGLAYLVIDPAGPGHTSLLGSHVRIDCESDPSVESPIGIPVGGFAAQFFVSAWNSRIRFAALDAELAWLATEQ